MFLNTMEPVLEGLNDESVLIKSTVVNFNLDVFYVGQYYLDFFSVHFFAQPH